MNTIRHSQDDEPARERRSLDAREGIDLWGTTTQSPTGDGCVVGGSRSGKGCEVNAGDLPGQDPKGTPAEVRAAIVAKAGCGQDGTPVSAERSRPTTGGAKGGRKANPGSDGHAKNHPRQFPARDRQAGRGPVATPQGRTRSMESGDAGCPRKRGERKQVVQPDRQGVSGGRLAIGWEKVLSNAGACGVDGITVERFEEDSRKSAARRERAHRERRIPTQADQTGLDRQTRQRRKAAVGDPDGERPRGADRVEDGHRTDLRERLRAARATGSAPDEAARTRCGVWTSC